ncbi:coiled-coil domain-containing protein 183 [Ambystoma mexicanum]|uniref:coiled-coil domain-containing protein 183 n=1 Tax=Ambystoma mexicanum TaxID=8296 RepID=UPI0037E8591E
MRYRKKWDIHEQIRELRVILGLQEQGHKAYRHLTEKTIYQNKDSIHHLKGILRDDIHLLSEAKKHDATTIKEAFKGRKKRRLAFSRANVAEAREALKKYVFDSINMLNKLIYEVKRRRKLLERLTSELETLKLMPEKPDSGDQQRIRRLENSIEKVDIKLAAAKAIHSTYLNILEYLKDEVMCFPLSLGVMESTLASYSRELTSMTQMADEANETRDEITTELTEMEQRFIQERKTRDNTMNWQRRMLKEILDKPHQKRDVPKKPLNVEFQSLLGRETPVQAAAKTEAEKAMIKNQQKLMSDIDNLKNAVHCSEIEDIAGRFAEMEDTSERLQKHLEETNELQETLLTRLHGLELQQVKMKFHQVHGIESFDTLDTDLKSNLKLEEEKLEEIKRKLFQNQELRLTVQNGIDNLYIKLFGITPVKKDAPPVTPKELDGTEPARKTPKESYKKLDVCQEKLVYLMEIGASSLEEEWLTDEHAEPFMQVRELLEASTTHEPRNTKIDLDTDDGDDIDAFEFEAVEQEYAPSREDIKRESQRIIDTKKKVSKPQKKKHRREQK